MVEETRVLCRDIRIVDSVWQGRIDENSAQ